MKGKYDYAKAMNKYQADNSEVFGEEEPRKMKQSGGSKGLGPAGNAVSPPIGRAYKGGESAGQRGYGKASYSSPPQQSYSNRAYSGGQSRGTKGWSDNEPPTSIVSPKSKQYVDKKGG